jgi:urea transport system permease protein
MESGGAAWPIPPVRPAPWVGQETKRRCARHLRALLAILLLVLAGHPVHAADLTQALQGFAADSYSDTADAIDALAASGDPRAEAIIQALQDERLFFTADPPKALIQTSPDSFADAATGAPATPESEPQHVRQNNRIRTMVATALGSLTLLSGDPAKRLAAAHSVFKSRDAAALPALAAALAHETDRQIAGALKDAQAAIMVGQVDAPDAQRIEAARILGARGDQAALAALQSAPADLASPPVKAAISAAIASAQGGLAFAEAAQNIWYGLSLGSILLLAAIGLAITFGVMGVINMAHGEMIMLGAYVTFAVQEVIRGYAPNLFGWSLPIAVPLAFLATGLVGIVIERGLIRFLYGRPLETLLATWGVSLILQQAVRSYFGPDNREVGAPAYMSGAFDVAGMQITYGRLWIIVFALAIFVGLNLLLRFTPLGLQMRAVTQNRRMAASMGIATPRVDALTFGLGSGIAGIAGVALSQIDNVSPNLGQSYIIDSFMVVVFGGVGNLWGTLVGAFTLGIANKFLEPFAGAVLAKIVILVFLILFMQRRPRGLFALKGRAVET